MSVSGKKISFLITHNKKGVVSLKEEIVRLINSAEKNIFLSTWLLNLEEVKDVLLKKASELKGHIYCLMAIERNNYRYQLSPAYKNSVESEIDDLQEKYNFKALQELSGSNSLGAAVEIRGHSNCHAKFLIIDEKVMVICSANFTHSSLEIGPYPILNRNEVGLRIEDTKLVQQLTILFKDMYLLRYNAQYPFKGPEKGEIHPVVYSRQIIHNNKNNLSELIDTKINPTNGLELIWTYDIIDEKYYPTRFNPKKFLDRLKDILENEDQFVYITAYSIADLAGTEIDDLLIRKANDEKIKIIIIIDVKNKDRLPEKLKELEALDNFDIFYHPGTHAKFILTSKNWMISTANIDGTHGLRNSFEVGILGVDPEIYQKFKDFYFDLLSECQNSKEILSQISSNERLRCGKCGRSFINKNNLNDHLNSLTHQPRTIDCPHCAMKFKSEQSLNQHIKVKHLESN